MSLENYQKERCLQYKKYSKLFLKKADCFRSISPLLLSFFLVCKNLRIFSPVTCVILLVFIFVGIGPCQSNQPVRYIKTGPFEKPKVEEGEFFFLFTDHYDNVGYLSPDMPTFLSFGQWTGIKRNFPEIYLILDVPSEMTIHGGRFVKTITEETKRKINDEHEFKRYRIGFDYGKYETRSGMTQLVCTTTLNAGDALTAYYGTEINGKICHKKSLLLKIVEIQKPGPPEYLFTFFDTFGTSLIHYPDFKHLREIGFNMVGGFSTIPKTTIKELAKRSSDAKLEFMSWNNEKAEGQNWQAETIDGKRQNTICPTYRGADLGNWIKDGQDLIDSGIFIHVTDPERNDGEKICFCRRCLEQFETYFKKIYPEMEFVSPVVFMKNPSKHHDHVQVWTDFKSENYANLYLFYRSAIEQYIKYKGLANKLKLFLYAQPNYQYITVSEKTKSSDIPMIRTSLQDPKILARVFDFFCPMIYIDIHGQYNNKLDMLDVSEEVRNMRQYLGEKDVPIIPALSPGFPYTEYAGFDCDIPSNGTMKYQVLEAFASGVKGVGIYNAGFFDALDMKYFAEAISQILPVEKILANGDLIPPEMIEDANSQTFVKGIKDSTGNAVILVSEYSNQPRTAKVIYRDGNKDNVVIDLADGHEIPLKTFQGKSEMGFELSLTKERARLFWVKNANAPK